MINYSKQLIDEEDIDSVIKVLKSDFLTQGNMVSRFEKSIADYCNSKYAVVFSSGTAALHSAYYAAGLKSGDDFITYEVNTTSKINSPKSFYDFLEALNKSDWIVGVEFPITFIREDKLIKSSFKMNVYSGVEKSQKEDDRKKRLSSKELFGKF